VLASVSPKIFYRERFNAAARRPSEESKSNVLPGAERGHLHDHIHCSAKSASGSVLQEEYASKILLNFHELLTGVSLMSSSSNECTPHIDWKVQMRTTPIIIGRTRVKIRREQSTTAGATTRPEPCTSSSFDHHLAWKLL
jgi:hypothetical protein